MDKLIDTGIFVDYLRGIKKADLYLNSQLSIKCSLITAAEIIQGAENKLSYSHFD